MLSSGAEFAFFLPINARTMNFPKPFIRFRRTRSETFHDGFLRSARQEIAFDCGAADNLRGEVAKLKQKVDRLTAELIKQRAVVGMLRVRASKPAEKPACPECRTLVMPAQLEDESQNRSHNDGQGSKSPVHQRAAAETNVIIRLIPDENWP